MMMACGGIRKKMHYNQYYWIVKVYHDDDEGFNRKLWWKITMQSLVV